MTGYLPPNLPYPLNATAKQFTETKRALPTITGLCPLLATAIITSRLAIVWEGPAGDQHSSSSSSFEKHVLRKVYFGANPHFLEGRALNWAISCSHGFEIFIADAFESSCHFPSSPHLFYTRQGVLQLRGGSALLQSDWSIPRDLHRSTLVGAKNDPWPLPTAFPQEH